MKAATSTIVLATPTTPSMIRVSHWFGQIPIRAIGRPQRTTPTPKSVARRERLTIAMVASAPTRPPIPVTELRNPTPALPVSSNWNAITTMNTRSAPATRV